MVSSIFCFLFFRSDIVLTFFNLKERTLSYQYIKHVSTAATNIVIKPGHRGQKYLIFCIDSEVFRRQDLNYDFFGHVQEFLFETDLNKICENIPEIKKGNNFKTKFLFKKIVRKESKS